MKKIFLTLILSFAILSCETPNEEANSDLPTVIDETELVAIADAMYEAMNSDDVESVLNFYADEAAWSFPNGVNIEGKEAIGQMLATTTSIWDITREEGTNYIALKGSDTNENGGITATIDGVVTCVPLSQNNRHYIEIMRQVEAGTLTIAEAE